MDIQQQVWALRMKHAEERSKILQTMRARHRRELKKVMKDCTHVYGFKVLINPKSLERVRLCIVCSTEVPLRALTEADMEADRTDPVYEGEQ